MTLIFGFANRTTKRLAHQTLALMRDDGIEVPTSLFVPGTAIPDEARQITDQLHISRQQLMLCLELLQRKQLVVVESQNRPGRLVNAKSRHGRQPLAVPDGVIKANPDPPQRAPATQRVEKRASVVRATAIPPAAPPARRPVEPAAQPPAPVQQPHVDIEDDIHQYVTEALDALRRAAAKGAPWRRLPESKRDARKEYAKLVRARMPYLSEDQPRKLVDTLVSLGLLHTCEAPSLCRAGHVMAAPASVDPEALRRLGFVVPETVEELRAQLDAAHAEIRQLRERLATAEQSALPASVAAAVDQILNR